ncbi:MAG TPA: hypothetical protein VIN09_11690 [Chloroflexota bacterium]
MRILSSSTAPDRTQPLTPVDRWRVESLAARETVNACRGRLERLAQVVARRFDLKLQFGQENALSDGELTVSVQSVGRFDAADLALLKGRALRLAARHRWGSREVDELANREGEHRPGYRTLWEALEQARVDTRLIATYPGALPLLRTVLVVQLSELPARPLVLEERLAWGMHLGTLGDTPEWLGDDARALLEQADHLLAEARSAETADRCWQVFRRIYLLWSQHLKPRDDEELMEDPMCLPSVNPRPRRELRGEVEQHVERNGQPPTPGQVESEEQPQLSTWFSASQSYAEWAGPGTRPWFETGGGKEVHPAARCSDAETIEVPPLGDEERYRQLMTEVHREIGVLQQRLVAVVKEQERLRFEGRFRTGRPQRARLWRHRLADYRLFERRVGRGRRSLAVSLLLDESASMDRPDKCRPAQLAAIMLAEVFEALHVPFEIIGYSTEDLEARTALRLGLWPAHNYRHVRCTRLKHYLYKRFEEPFYAVRTRLVHVQPRHNNWDEEHLEFAFRRLARRTEPERLLINISDGQPNGDAENLIRTVRAIERQGCTVVGVGVGCDYVRRIYANAVVVQDFPQLASELAALLARALLGRDVYPRPTSQDQPEPAPDEPVADGPAAPAATATPPSDPGPPGEPRQHLFSLGNLLYHYMRRVVRESQER